MNRELLELVTAYVDGEATPDERARVDADGELLAEVARQRAVRTMLHEVEAPSDSARESAIAAALRVFDDAERRVVAAAPAGDVTAPTNIVPLEQGRGARWMQGLGAAAAVAAIVVAGAVIATRGGDDGTADEQRLTTAVASEDADGPDGASELPEAAAEAPAEAPAEAVVATERADDVLMATTATVLTDAAAGPAPAAAPAPGPGRFVVVTSSDELSDLADTIKVALLALDVAETSCAEGALKADAAYQDADGVRHEIVVVAIDEETVGALSLGRCDVVLEADR